MRQLAVRSLFAVYIAMVAGNVQTEAQDPRPATLTLVFLRMAPGGDTQVVLADARQVLTDDELAVITKRNDYHGLISLASVVAVPDADLPHGNSRAIIVLTRWPADGAERQVPAPAEPGVVYLQSVTSEVPGKAWMVYSSTESDERGPRHDPNRAIRLTLDGGDGATVRYAVERPDRSPLEGEAFTWARDATP